MDDGELYDLTNGIKDVEAFTTDQQIALLQVQAITALGYQVCRLGMLVEDLTEPAPPVPRPRWK